VETPVTLQQKMMRHTDIRTARNTWGDVVTHKMSVAGIGAAEPAFHINRAQAVREAN
jgi:hypothetical protein